MNFERKFSKKCSVDPKQITEEGSEDDGSFVKKISVRRSEGAPPKKGDEKESPSKYEFVEEVVKLHQSKTIGKKRRLSEVSFQEEKNDQPEK
jgi:hypothetical protein